MKVLITGANGFVGKNLRSELTLHEGVEVFCYDIDSTPEDLRSLLYLLVNICLLQII